MEFSPKEMKPNPRWNGVEVREAADMMDADRIINQSGGEGTQIYDHQTQRRGARRCKLDLKSELEKLFASY